MASKSTGPWSCPNCGFEGLLPHRCPSSQILYEWSISDQQVLQHAPIVLPKVKMDIDELLETAVEPFPTERGLPGEYCMACEMALPSSGYHDCPMNPKMETTKEAVNHPAHYGGDTPYEVIKVLQEWLTHEEFVGALKFNIIKYLARAKKKNGTEDIKKATWYQNKLDEYLKEHV